MKFFFSFLLTIAVATALDAQTTVLRGIARDSASGAPLAFASVALLQLPDSTEMGRATTDETGAFALPAATKGAYILKLNLVGYTPFLQKIQLPAAAPITVAMQPSANVLGTVNIQEQIIPILMDGDTVTYNAAAFKVKENAVAEDLLKKLPGVEVDRQGNIKAMGQDVRQVLVDGKPFFGNDPKMATKNLPADAIDQVKVYDKRSDQSTFSGFDDGSGEKVVDIRLKADRRRGSFGRFTGGYGTEDRFTGGGMFNRFSPKEQLSVMGSANNVNDFGFSFEEMMQSGLVSINGAGGAGEGDGESSGGVTIQRGGPSMGGQNQGIARSFITGMNYWRAVSPRFTIDGNLLLNGADTRLEQDLRRQNFFADSTVDFRQAARNRDQRLNPRLRLEMDWKLDSFNVLNLKTNGSWTARQTENLRDYSFGLSGEVPFSRGINRQNRDATRSQANAILLWKRRFRQKGHTFSMQAQTVLQPGQADADNDFFSRDTLLQRSGQQDWSSAVALKASYTRPLRKRNRFAELTWSVAQNHFDSDKRTVDFDPDRQEYATVNPFFTNGLIYNFFNQQLGANYRRERLRYDFSAGLSAQHSVLQAYATAGAKTSGRSFIHLLPNANARFTLNKTSHLRLRLQSVVQPPSVRFLLPAPDNSNPQTLRLSNPDLRPEQRYSLQANVQSFNIERLRTLMVMSNVALVRDRIASDIARNPSGQQVIRYINTTQGVTATAFALASFPLRPRTLRFSANVNNIVNSGYGFLNGQRNNNLLWMKGGGARLSYEKGEWLLLEAGLNAMHNDNRNSASTPAINRFWNVAAEGGGELSLPHGWKISADVAWNRYTGQGTALNITFILLNGSIGKRFLKKEAGFVELAVRDALNQNLGIERFPGDGYLEEVRNNLLRRYVMLKFTYRLLPKGAAGGGQPGGLRLRF